MSTNTTERVGQIKTEIKMRNEQLAAQASERNNGILTPVAKLAHHEAVHALHVELIGLIEGGSTAPAAAPTQAAVAPVKATPAAVKVAPKATTAPTTTEAKPTTAATSEATCTLKVETVKALAEYNAIDENDSKARAAFRESHKKELGL